MSLRIKDLTEDNVETFSDTDDFIALGGQGTADDYMMTIANFCKAVSQQISTETEVLENKSIDCDDNPVTNINGANVKDGTIPLAKLVALGNNFALISSAAGVITVSAVTATELARLNAVTAGTVADSKVLVVDSNKALDQLVIGNLSVSKLLVYSGTPDEVDDSGAGGSSIAADLAKQITNVITGTDPCTVTLGSGTEGQIKYICFKTDGGGNCIIDPSSFKGSVALGDVVTLTEIGQMAIFLYNESVWYYVGGVGGTRS